MKYIANDGKVFDTEEACLKHETALAMKEAEKKKKEEEKQKAAKELRDQYDSIMESVDKWMKASIEFQNKYEKEKSLKISQEEENMDRLVDFLLDYFG